MNFIDQLCTKVSLSSPNWESEMLLQQLWVQFQKQRYNLQVNSYFNIKVIARRNLENKAKKHTKIGKKKKT